MLRLDLTRLERTSKERLEWSIPDDSPLWLDTELSFRGPVAVEGRARALTHGEVLVEGTVQGMRTGACRRCLVEVERPFDRPFTFYYVPVGEADEADPEARPLPKSEPKLDLEHDVREELILALSEYPLCREDCKGLCPTCGTDFNSASCDCQTTEPDPRWEVLRSLHE